MAALSIEYTPMRNIRLCAQLRQFGKSYPLAVRTPAEAIKALCVQIPGLERFISNAKSRGLEFAVFVGEEECRRDGAGFPGRRRHHHCARDHRQ